MVEYGQPMHAFDYRYVKGGKIVVRRAGADKTLTTLDGNVRVLQPDMLVIADETKPVGLAGVMGGENSEIVADTVESYLNLPTSSALPSPRQRWHSACAQMLLQSLKRISTRC